MFKRQAGLEKLSQVHQSVLLKVFLTGNLNRKLASKFPPGNLNAGEIEQF